MLQEVKYGARYLEKFKIFVCYEKYFCKNIILFKILLQLRELKQSAKNRWTDNILGCTGRYWQLLVFFR